MWHHYSWFKPRSPILISTAINDHCHWKAKGLAGRSRGTWLWCFTAQGQMQTSLPIWKQGLLHGQAPLSAGWLCAPRVHVGDMYQGCWPWVHFSAQVSLWAEPNWDGECILVKILSNLIKTFSTGGGVNIATENTQRALLQRLRNVQERYFMHVQKKLIQCFINWSWQFIDSYNKGLTGDAASWVVHKQKGHQSVSEGTMKALEAWSSSK